MPGCGSYKILSKLCLTGLLPGSMQTQLFGFARYVGVIQGFLLVITHKHCVVGTVQALCDSIKRHRWRPQGTNIVASDVQGVLQLLETAEIRDVLATAGVQFEQLRRMGPFGGVVLQLQGIMQKGFKVSPCHLHSTQYSSMHYIQCSSLSGRTQHRNHWFDTARLSLEGNEA